MKPLPLKAIIERIIDVQFRIEHYIATVGMTVAFSPTYWVDAGDHLKPLAPVDLLAERWFEEHIAKLSASSGDTDERNFVFLGEERLHSAVDLSNEKRPVWLVDMIDGTDLLERGFGNWCSAVILFDPREELIQATFVILPNKRAYYATQEGAFQARLKPREDTLPKMAWPAEPLGKPNETKELHDASVCLYAQKSPNLLSLLDLHERAPFVNWLQQPAPDQNRKPKETRFRFYNLAGNPMMVRIPEGNVDVVLDLRGQYPHDLVPGAFIALKAGACLATLTGQEINEEALGSTVKKPGSQKLGYILAANHKLKDEMVGILTHAPAAKTLSVGSTVSGVPTAPARFTPKRREAPMFPVRADIDAFRKRNNLDSMPVIDEYLQLHHSPDWRGWRTEGILRLIEAGDYSPTPELAALMQKYPPSGPVNLYYSFCGWEPLLTADEELTIQLRAQNGTWAHVVALNTAWEKINIPPLDPDCQAVRNTFEDYIPLLPAQRARLYHQMNTEVLLVSSDNQIVLARRRPGSPFSGHRWTASLEEQMLRWKRDTKQSDDADLVSCAIRGTTSEFKVTIIAEATRLLSFGLEWGNFTAAFLFLLRCEETFDRIVEVWPNADDANEAVALDCLPAAQPDVILDALSSDRWNPSERCRVAPWAPDAKHPDFWHPVARARLDAYLRHIGYY